MQKILFAFLNFAFCFQTFHAVYIPEPWQTALMSRYIINNVDWVAISTISTLKDIKSYPFVSVQSISDGPINNGSGIPYFFLTDLDLTATDILADNRVTIVATLAEVDYCKTQNYDTEDPRCAKLIITGKMIKVNKTDNDYEYAQNALFSRHAPMSAWAKVHKFYIAKVDLEQIIILDNFGGAKYVTKEDYFNAHSGLTLPQINYNVQDISVIIVQT